MLIPLGNRRVVAQLTDERVPPENEWYPGRLAHLNPSAVDHRVRDRFGPDPRMPKERWNPADCLSSDSVIRSIELDQKGRNQFEKVGIGRFDILARHLDTPGTLRVFKLESIGGCRNYCATYDGS